MAGSRGEPMTSEVPDVGRPWAVPRASRPISSARACALILQLRLQRMGRSLGWARSHGPTARRGAPSERGHLGWLWKALITTAGLLLATALGMTELFSSVLTLRLGPNEIASAASAQLALLCFTVLCLDSSWANRMSARGARDIEWLLMLPISAPAIYVIEVLERAVFNVWGWWLIYPLVVGLVHQQGLFWSAPLVSVLLFLSLSLPVALGSVVVDHALGRLPASQIIRAVLTLLGVGLMMIVPAHPGLSAALRSLPWLPTEGVVGVILALNGGLLALLGQLTLCIAQSSILLALGYASLALLLAKGGAPGQSSRLGQRGALAQTSRPLGSARSAIITKDVRQLLRDSSMWYVAVLLPLVQLLVLALTVMTLESRLLVGSSQHLPLLAFGIGVMSSLASSSALTLEGTSLWLLFELPRSLGSMLLSKAVLWVLLSCAYVAIVFAFGLFHQPLSWSLLAGAVHAFSGVALLALCGVGLSVHVVDPGALARGERSFRGGSSFLLLSALAAVFAFGFYADHWTRASLVLLLGAATLGIWQTSTRTLPFVLDPERRPPAIVSLSDGLTCALAFTTLQSVGTLLLAHFLELQGWLGRLTSFVLAGVFVIAVTLVVLRRRGVSGLPSALGWIWPDSLRPALRSALLWGAPAVGVGAAYAAVMSHWPGLTEAARAAAPPAQVPSGAQLWSYPLLAIVAAPLVEEVIFRGLIFRSLRATLSINVSAALASTIFALAHPGLSFAPVFVMGFLAARALERSGSLISAILVHAAYNAALMVATALVS